MENNKAIVKFICSPERAIVVDFTLNEDNMLSYQARFEPKEIDPKEPLGLAGELCEFFITKLNENVPETKVDPSKDTNAVDKK